MTPPYLVMVSRPPDLPRGYSYHMAEGRKRKNTIPGGLSAEAKIPVRGISPP
jgi:hypothetical protein